MDNQSNGGILWIDLTLLIHWQGQLTGIQRVEYNLAKRFAKRPYVKFCVFDKTRRAFFEYDFDNVETKITSLRASTSITELAMPSSTNYAQSLRRKAGSMLPKAVKRTIKSTRLNQRTSESLRFKKADKLLILSGDWSDEIFSMTVTKMKQDIGFKVIQVVHDLLPVTEPAFFLPGMPRQVSSYMTTMLKVSDVILANSEATKKDVLSFQAANQLPKHPIRVFRAGEDFVDQAAIKPDLTINPDQFLLCVSTIEARKNHLSLYYVIRQAMQRNIEIPPIVIAGKRGSLTENFIYLVTNDPVISQKILFLHGGTDRELAWLFQNCKFTLYPSFYEGWGIPIAESLFYGKLCLASSSSSMPEIAGDLIDYYSPNNPAEILDCIVKYLSDSKLLRKRENLIKNSYTPTSWDDTFEQVEDYLLKLG